MTAKLRIIPRNFHYEATLSTEFDAALGCAITNTQNRKRSRVWRSDDTSSSLMTDDQYIAGTFEDDLDRSPDFFGFFRHRCHGGTVRLQLYSDANWTIQVLDTGAQNVINTPNAESNDWGIDPYGAGSRNPFIVETPYWIYFDPVACLSYKITFSGPKEIEYGAAYWEVCQFTLGRSFEAAYPPAFGAELGFIDLTELDRSRGGTLHSNVGAQARTMKMNLERIPETDRAAWLDIVRHAGLGRDVVVQLFADENQLDPTLQYPRRELDYTMLGTFSALDAISRQVNRLTKVIQFQEA